jgi:BirA family transcriptional regulator, biotin operon repressor / biotin---[acetyl-CoA-carboxylase] ligase
MKLFNRDHFYTCTSTIDLAERAINQPNIADFIPQVITADKQTRGRGRTGASWFSPEGCGLYVSFIVPVEEYHEFLTMWIGAAIVRELKRYTHLDIRQAGINDLFLDNRKLGGIICEVYKGYLIVGVGLNTFRPTRVRKDLDKTAVWLNEFSNESLLSTGDLLQVLAEAIIK